MKIGIRIKKTLEEKGLNKAEFARKIGMSPQSLNGLFKRESIETKNLEKIADALEMPIDHFFPTDVHSIGKQRTEFIPVFMNNEREGVIPIMNKKAAAGYPAHVNDIDYLKDLPYIAHPHFTDAQYLCIQVKGDSMEPTLGQDDYIIGRYVDDPMLVRDGEVYVVVLKDGVLVKRVETPAKVNGDYTLISDNQEYAPVKYEAEEIQQLWECKLRMTADFSKGDDTVGDRMNALEQALESLKEQVKS